MVWWLTYFSIFADLFEGSALSLDAMLQEGAYDRWVGGCAAGAAGERRHSGSACKGEGCGSSIAAARATSRGTRCSPSPSALAPPSTPFIHAPVATAPPSLLPSSTPPQSAAAAPQECDPGARVHRTGPAPAVPVAAGPLHSLQGWQGRCWCWCRLHRRRNWPTSWRSHYCPLTSPPLVAAAPQVQGLSSLSSREHIATGQPRCFERVVLCNMVGMYISSRKHHWGELRPKTMGLRVRPSLLSASPASQLHLAIDCPAGNLASAPASAAAAAQHKASPGSVLTPARRPA